MSMMLMVKAFNLKVKNPVRKLILIKLADNANDKGECWPSHQYIADQCEVSRRTVIHHLNELEKSGLIRIENRFKNNSKQSNVYHLNLDAKQCEEYSQPCAGSSQGSEIYSQGSEESAQGGSEESAHRTSNSFEPVIESIKETKSASKSPVKFNPKDYLIDLGVSEDCAEEFLNHRKAKKATSTKRVIDKLMSESIIAGVSLEQFLDFMVFKGWTSLSAEWYANAHRSNAVQQFNPNKQEALEERNKKVLEDYLAKRGLN